MAKIKINGLRDKKTAGGIRYYWEPSATLKAAGWTPLPLGLDRMAAIAAAEKRNAEVTAWRTGGAKPREVAPLIVRHTVDHIIAEFKRVRFPRLKDSTQAEYASKLKMVSRWAGDTRMDGITRNNVLALRDALYAPRKDGSVRVNTAYGALKVLRTLFDWAIENQYLPPGFRNPAAGDLDVQTPAARQQFASPGARDALVAAGEALGRPNMVAAMILAWTIGQRQADLLKLPQNRFNAIEPFEADDPAVYDRIAAREPDGRVMGIRLRQGKTDRWVGVPVVGDARVRLDAAIAAARAKKLTTILYDEARDRTWTSASLSEQRTRQAHFQRSYAEIRAAAVTATIAAGDAELAAEITGLEFRDFRRTCVVVMGQRGLPDHLISAITGHRLETVKKILEVYLPRTTGMALLAIDLSTAREPVRIDRSKTA